METFLLDKRYQLILKMIEELSQSETRERSITDLETKLGISNKTIRNYFQSLLHYCKDRNLETFTLTDGKIKMKPNTNFNIIELYHDFMQKSVKYQIMINILNQPRITFTNLYLDLSISQTTCSNHIKQLNDFFSDYHCKINFSKTHLLQGEPHQVRFLCYNLFWGLNQDDIIASSPKLDAVIDFLLELVPSINYTILSRIKLAFYIFQVTSKNGLFLNPEIDFTLQNSPFITYDDFFQKLDELDFLEHCPDLETKQIECRYLYFIFSRQNILTLEVCERLTNKIPCVDDPHVQYVIAELQEHYQISLRTPEVKCLGANLSFFFKEVSIFKGRAKTFELEKLLNNFDSTRAKSSKSIQTFLEGVYDANQSIMTFVQNFPSLHLYCKMLLRVILAKHQYPIKLLVQSSISTLHREALISQIKNSTPFPITIHSFHELNGEMPDAIISNWLPPEKFKDVPFFSISYFFTDWHKASLMQFLNQISAKKLIN